MAKSDAFPASIVQPQTRAAGASYVARVAGTYAQVERVWERMAQQGAALPFQRRGWLPHWYAAHEADYRPLPVTITLAGSDEPVMALPLALYRDGPLRIIAFADGGLTDYNAPILGPHAPADAAGAALIMRSLKKALPPADILYFGKMPEHIGAMVNPLALLPQAVASSLNGNVLHVPGTWDDWHWGLERTFRKELERSLRVFLKAEGAEFRHITAPAEVACVYATLKRQQCERIRELGLPYILDQPEHEAFYDALVADGLASGNVILTALKAGDEIVAALLGITDGHHYAMVRLSTGGTKWKSCSPGRLLIERTLRMLHAEGYRTFDFTIGDYPYKRRMGVSPLNLREITQALSWRGWPVVIREKARAAIKARPALLQLAKKLRGVK